MLESISQYIYQPRTYLESYVSVVVALCVLTVLYYHRQFSYWSKYNVKTPPPIWFFGNGLQLLSKRRLDYEVEWPRKYGKVYGHYLGTIPRLVVADAEVLRRICIKDFHLFPNHRFSTSTHPIQDQFVFTMKDDQWKRSRSIMSPTFTSGRMKRMAPKLNECAQELEQIFREQAKLNGNVINCKDVFGLYAMDCITTCCFGVKLKHEKNNANVRQAASRDSFVEAAVKIVEPDIPRLLLMFLLPEFLLKMVRLTPNSSADLDNMYKRAKAIVESRRHMVGNHKYNDFLQLLMEAELSNEIDVADNDAKESHHVSETNDSIRDQHRTMTKAVNTSNKHLTDSEIVANSMFFLFVGYDTTASLLTHATYALAFHPNVQQKFYEEIKRIREPDGTFTYDKVTNSEYLDAVLCETLRLMTPVLSLDRVSNEDYFLEEHNLTIPKDAQIECAYYAIHHDPDYWPEPNKFDPDRFAPENRNKIVPGSYCPFGLGPRHCLGMRFSLTETKVAMVRLVTTFEFVPAPNTMFPPKPSNMYFLLKYENLVVKLVEREQS